MEESFILDMFIGVSIIGLYIIETILLCKTKVFDPKYSRVEDAKKRGHVLSAKCIKGNFSNDENLGKISHRPSGTYEYYVDGKRYEFGHVFTSMDSTTPPRSVTIYYLDNPKKYFMEDRYNFKRLLFHIIPWGTTMLIYSLIQSML